MDIRLSETSGIMNKNALRRVDKSDVTCHEWDASDGLHSRLVHPVNASNFGPLGLLKKKYLTIVSLLL